MACGRGMGVPAVKSGSPLLTTSPRLSPERGLLSRHAILVTFHLLDDDVDRAEDAEVVARLCRADGEPVAATDGHRIEVGRVRVAHVEGLGAGVRIARDLREE